MAIIYSYPTNNNLLATDILVGTTTTMIGGKRKNQTKSFELGELVSFISSGLGFVPYVGATGSVDLGTYNLTANSIIKAGGTNVQFLMADGSVTTGPVLTGLVPYTGAISTVNLGVNDIYARWGFLNELRLFDASYSTYGEISLQGESFLIKSSPTQVLANIEPGSLGLLGFGPGALLWEAKFTYTTLTADRVYALPNTSGTIALTSDIPIFTGFVPYTGATQAVNLGAYNLLVNGVSVGIGAGNITSNTAIGNLALSSNTTGTFNSAFGSQSMLSNTDGRYNSAYGHGSLQNNTTGQYNTAVGLTSLLNNTSALYNTACGFQALLFTTTGGENSAYGRQSLRNNTTGIQNVGFGAFSSLLNATDSNCIVIGYNVTGAGSNTVTLGNTSITTTRLRGNVQGGSFVKDGGTNSQYLMADGSVSNGPFVPYTGATGAVNLGAYDLIVNGLTVGKGTGTGNLQNTAVGVLALSSATTSTSNTAIGFSALKSNTTGPSNVAVGREALLNVTTGEGNVAVGSAAGIGITTGGRNIFIGLVAGGGTTTGGSNTFMGDFAGRFNTVANGNTAIGKSAGFYFATGSDNTAVGLSSGYNNESGNRSVFIGYQAGVLAGSGTTYAINVNNSVLIGSNTRVSATPATNQIVIGDSALGIGDNTVTLGNTSIVTTRLRGDVVTNGSLTGSQFKLSALNTAPASASATGVTGEIRYDSDYMYVCVATNTWKRALIATW
jgi:hypothetical protein